MEQSESMITLRLPLVSKGRRKGQYLTAEDDDDKVKDKVERDGEY